MARHRELGVTADAGERLKHHRTLHFPPGFLWGAATSAHQVEGGNTANDWWAWERAAPGRPRSDRACDQFRRYREDLRLVKSLGHTACRFSLEWSRIEPHPGTWDRAAVSHYRDLIAECRRLGLTPMVTLHHFTNPRWVAAAGGWTKRRTARQYLRYVRFIVAELGDLVEFWITINEPLVYALQSYLVALWPPQKKSYWLTARVYWQFVRAHRAAYQSIHAIYRRERWPKPKVGFTANAVSLYAYRQHSLPSWLFIRVADWIWNHSFITLTGRRHHDLIAVNYYFHYRLKALHFKTLRFFLQARDEHREMSEVGWEVYPQGMFDVLLDYRGYGLPVYITENGIATTHETKRARYLVAYLKEVYHAIQAGVNVQGYFWWSLLDNYEWHLGFGPRFGLLGVNFHTQERSVRPAAVILSQIATGNAIPHRLLGILGHSVPFATLGIDAK